MSMDPAWMPDKLRLINLSVRDHIESVGMPKVTIGGQCSILETDLAADKVHLTEEGKTKYVNSILNNQNDRSEPIDWATTPTPNRFQARGGLRTNVKRVRTESGGDEESNQKKKERSDEFVAIMAHLATITENMQDERAAATEKN